MVDLACTSRSLLVDKVSSLNIGHRYKTLLLAAALKTKGRLDTKDHHF